MLGKLASKGQPGVQYGKVDLQKSPQMGQEYGVRSIPDTRIFHNGKEIGGFVGSQDAASIEALVAKYQSSVRPEGEMNGGGAGQTATGGQTVDEGEMVKPAIQRESANKGLPPGITPL